VCLARRTAFAEGRRISTVQDRFVERRSTAPLRAMNLDLTDAESAALLAEFDRVIDNDRYPFSPRIRTLPAQLARFALAQAFLFHR
jgi:hypothetical protein